MADDAGEKTESATPKRRQDARRKGTVAKSNDLTGSLVLLAVAMVLPSASSTFGRGILTAMQGGLVQAPQEFSALTIQQRAFAVLQPAGLSFAMVVGTAMAVGLMANFAQVGFVLSAEAMAPSLTKLNPLNGFKRLFSMRATVEGLKAIAKSLLFGLIAFNVLKANWGVLVGMSYATPALAAAQVGGIAHTILLRVSITWLVIAALDYAFQRSQVEKELRMTRDELKREMKEQEASPELKGERMKRMRKMMKGRPLEKVKTADVIITNPTHFSVAISYERSSMHAPMVVAKGQDILALKIREIAKEHGVAIVPNPPLARQLYKQCEIGDYVPRELFGPVAEVLAYVYNVLRRKKAS